MSNSNYKSDLEKTPSKNQQDIFNFIRTVEKSKDLSFKENEKLEKIKIALSFSLILYENEINIQIKEVEDKLNTISPLYEIAFTHNDFKKMNKFFEILPNLKMIFNLLKKTFEQNKDTISLENENINIKFIIQFI